MLRPADGAGESAGRRCARLARTADGLVVELCEERSGARALALDVDVDAGFDVDGSAKVEGLGVDRGGGCVCEGREGEEEGGGGEHGASGRESAASYRGFLEW